MTAITLPDFDFSGFYYPQILEALFEYKRTNAPELTDESQYETTIQLMRMNALIGHLNNTLIDLVANNVYLPPASMPEAIRNQLRLIAYELATASPAQADIIYELSKVFTASQEIVKANSQCATKKIGTVNPIYYEALDSLVIDRSDQHSYVYAEESSVFTDYTAEANSPTTPADDWTPWSTPADGDAIYWGHKQVLWDKLTVNMTTVLGGTCVGVWEYYDSEWQKTAPTSVTDLGGSLEFDLTSMLGTSNRKGTLVKVQLNSTAVQQEVTSTWNGSKNIATTGLLGQSSPSTTASDYTIGSNWTIMNDVVDNTENLTKSGEDVELVLPQTLTQRWSVTDVEDNTAYWLRYRIIDASGITSGPVMRNTLMDGGKQYVKAVVTQGRTISEPSLGSSLGTASQTFETSKENFIWGSETVTVEGETWTRVVNFINSTSTSKHYKIVLGENDKANVKFGGNGKGKVPPTGVNNIGITYRYGAQEDGNVGANSIIVDKTGLSFVSRIWNPRQALGWEEAQSASEEGLELAKEEGPATLSTKDVALGAGDVEELARTYTNAAGSRLFSRAKAIEEGFGAKTIELVLVALGGGLATTEQLDEIEEYFNGDKYSDPPKEPHLVMNQEVGAVNYTQKIIDVTATVYGDVEKEEIEAQLAQYIQPEAKKEDGVTWRWNFGSEVPVSKINNIIFETDDINITKVVITVPASDIALTSRELPVLGTASITVVS